MTIPSSTSAGPPTTPMPPTTPAAVPGRMERTFDWLRDIADRGWSGTAVFAYGVLQSLVVPGLSDGLFLPLSLAQPKRAYRLALAAGLGTLVGATVLFWAGESAMSLLTGSFSRWLGVTAAGVAQAQDLLSRYGWLLVVGSTFSPISTKLLSASAGVFGMPYPVFIAALGVSRFARVFLLAWAVRRFGAEAVREALNLPASPRDDHAETARVAR